ncbi:pyruvate dehydrogenase E2 component (dihydrolipoamide acetyltransferase) [Blattabacterium sp. (Blatta orientalis) str. Tarazona]|uniref:dihydrolipoamide acetyltransferase family protein n=1 Tax=Blattabacterium sp. (Blatta orientalis) TaxID=367806 RepID=UPI0002AD9847|nr:dihydrolipoamide acetyltransferase family protein [Blattabacterium sp. (Blatta orientalis)]AGD98009.1 pyruvate dehydrogenase E2 component (dihydrolipoamide acetyltransferase) [Blattabacterium sp. (Blatta orientalis) str. Tarazona]
MAEIISMPQLSDTMEEGTIIKWNKKVGDKVSEGDILAEIETDKATQDFEIDVSGILLFIGVEEGKKTRVNDILAIIGEEGEDISHLIKNSKEKIKEKKGEKILSNENRKKNKDRIFISPLAKRMAKEVGISIRKIKGSGDHGRIIKRDIETYEKTLDDNNRRIVHEQIDDKRVILSSMRKKIAEHLTHSKFTAPHYYLIIEIDVGKMIQLRKDLNEKLSTEEKISFNDIIIKAVAISLKKNPNVNTSWKEEEIIYHSFINIGVAVAVKEGLIVPVIHNADQKSLLQISQEIKDKVLRSKSRKIKPEEIENSTFTVSNLGMYGIEFFTSIINIPNSSILSIGTITEKPIVKNSEISIGYVMKVTLSCDHRIIDGSTGSNFLKHLKNLLEDPILILV